MGHGFWPGLAMRVTFALTGYLTNVKRSAGPTCLIVGSTSEEHPLVHFLSHHHQTPRPPNDAPVSTTNSNTWWSPSKSSCVLTQSPLWALVFFKSCLCMCISVFVWVCVCMCVRVCVRVCVWKLYSKNGCVDFDETLHKWSDRYLLVTFFSIFENSNLMTSWRPFCTFSMGHSHGRNFCPIFFKI